MSAFKKLMIWQKNKITDKHNKGDNTVNRFEFRLLLIFVKYYFNMLKVFIECDKGFDG